MVASGGSAAFMIQEWRQALVLRRLQSQITDHPEWRPPLSPVICALSGFYPIFFCNPLRGFSQKCSWNRPWNCRHPRIKNDMPGLWKCQAVDHEIFIFWRLTTHCLAFWYPGPWFQARLQLALPCGDIMWSSLGLAAKLSDIIWHRGGACLDHFATKTAVEEIPPRRPMLMHLLPLFTMDLLE